jgi:hypothetical protein
VSCQLEGIIIIVVMQNHANCPDPIVFPTVAANLRTMDTDLDDIEADGETEIKEAVETD